MEASSLSLQSCHRGRMLTLLWLITCCVSLGPHKFCMFTDSLLHSVNNSFIHYTLSNPQIRCVAADIHM